MNIVKILTHTLILVFALCLFMQVPAIQAEEAGKQHFMVTASADLLNEDWVGYDLTWIYQGNWGIRYSLMPDVQFLENETWSASTQVSHYSVKGDFTSPFLLFTADYRTNRPGSSPFEWITAYYGAGYSKIPVTLKEERYTASGAVLVRQEFEEEQSLEQTSLVLGFSGQEKFLVLDTRFWIYQAKMPAKGILKKDLETQGFGLLVSIGLGF